ncbi:Sn1-specific diacylglycerol lipase beta, partial [Stegodyphus mimosarum]
MPGMRLFGRRCSLATDDFLFIGLIDSIIFLPWLAWIPVIYASYLKQRSTCEINDSVHMLDVALPGLCILFLMNWLVSAFFVIFSVKGTISQPEARRPVVKIVYIKLIVSALDFAWAIFGTVILTRSSFCDIIGVEVLIKATTIFQWIATFVRAGMMIVFYDWKTPKNAKTRTEKEYFTASVRTGTFKRWHLRLQALFLWCTTPSDARKEAIKTASELMALLSCDLDLVASDVLAGLLLYRQKCLQKWKTEKLALISTPPITAQDGKKLNHFPPDNLPSWMNLQLASRYFDIGLGVFGWPWYIYRNLTCGCCHLFRRLTCCFYCRKRSSKVLGDNCCGCNLAGLEATTGLPYEDLVHVSFVDKVFEVPFFITYDHETSAIIISVRGTMSMDDLLTDVAAAFANMDDPGCPPGALCHGGMLNAAREIKRKLEETNIIDIALKEKPGYKVVVTGHSLGASVASILTLLLKNSYPNIQCFAFAPAPTVNKIALPSTFDNVFTIVYGNDSVIYLNYENIKYMVVEMVKCLRNCNLPKYKVFMNYPEPNEIHNSNEKSAKIDKDPKANGTCNEGECFTSGSQCNAEYGGLSAPFVTESLYVGGTILHIRLTDDGYRMKLSTADDYKNLAFRPKMILHHFPQYMQGCLRHLGKPPMVNATTLVCPLD